MRNPCRYGFPLLLALLGCSQPDQEQDPNRNLKSATWPIFRGDSALTGIAEDRVPENPTLLWTFETGGEIVSTPVIGSGRVYVSSTDGKVYALDVAEGSQVWDFDAGDAVEASPMLLDSVLYVGSLEGVFFALSAETGQVLWKAELGSGVYGSANWAEVGEGAEKSILTGCYDNRLYCFGAVSGELKWTYETENYINGAPATDGRQAVFGGCDAILHIVDVADGSKIGGVDVGSYIPGSAAVVDGHAYVGHYNGGMVCINLADQKIVWNYPEADQEDAFFSSPAVGDDRVVVGSRDEQLHCIDRQTGQKVWTFRTRDKVDSSPVIAGESVFFGSDDGRLYRIDLASGRLLWSYEIGGAITGSPAVAGGGIFVGAEDGSIYAFGEAR
ncbi:MAG: PQQ-binding-like beta-propeller repeat protein [Gemmatimonadetes bacterium]|jgi:eukaryotic-like serine/threonine-protein kinase|nr:PQQ-binding-like beta-propeller repeat protein [Gemmatimonadota bacterium]